MSTAARKILVTSALPYANGDIHLGHLVGYIQTDIWVRFQKMRGNECYYICGDDAHGTPIMIKAQQMGITPDELVAKVKQEHERDFADFAVAFDNFYTTHSEENRQIAEGIYQKLKANGDISKKTIRQAYDAQEEMFLPDRFVKGTCPKCKAEDQYGDSCESCGATYDPTELIEPRSVISGTTPTEKESEHFFFELPNYSDDLLAWTQNGHLQKQVSHKLKEWFEMGLRAWDISRDAPYFGFEIPGEPGKYFYVWLDAPIGYMASFKQFCEQNPEVSFDEYWGKDSKNELYHFIGKDIIYFHSLFWPAMLKGADYRTPTAVYANGFLTVNGQKMSKSRGTFIRARTYLECLAPEYLRYYFAAKLNSNIEDLDLNLDDFMARINSDLVGKVVNIASRCAKFINKNYNNELAAELINPEIYAKFSASSEDIAADYENREFAKAVRSIMELADLANQYIDEQKPWVLIKESDKQAEVQQICSLGLNMFRALIIYLKPILPMMSTAVEELFNSEPLTWDAVQTPVLAQSIQQFQPLMGRITKDAIEKLTEKAAND